MYKCIYLLKTGFHSTIISDGYGPRTELIRQRTEYNEKDNIFDTLLEVFYTSGEKGAIFFKLWRSKTV